MAYSLAFWHTISVTAFIAVKMEYNKLEFLTTKYISERLGIPHSTVRKILKQLTMANIIEAREGAKGGVILTRDPRDITLLDLFIALEHKRPLFKTSKIDIDDERARKIGERVSKLFLKSELSIKDDFKSTTLKDIIG